MNISYPSARILIEQVDTGLHQTKFDELPTVLPFYRVHRYESNISFQTTGWIWKTALRCRHRRTPMSIKVANRAVARNARARLLCYPRGSFYPLSPAPPMWCRGITKTDFRPCSGCLPRSQAGLNFYAFPTVSIRGKPTFVSLRYNLAGYRPSKTAHLTRFLPPFPGGIGKTCHISKRGLTWSLAQSARLTNPNF